MKLIPLVASISIALNLLLFSILHKNTAQPSPTQTSPSSTTGTDYTVAVLSPAMHPSLEEIQDNLKRTLNTSNCACLFKEYNANGSKTLMRAQAEEIIADATVNVICTIGASASQMMHQLLLKYQRPTPLVFIAVSDPVNLQLVDSIEKPGGQVTGIADVIDQEQQRLDVLTLLKPSIKAVVLVYDPSQQPTLEQECAIYKQLLEQRGLSLYPVVVNHHNEVFTKTSATLERLIATLPAQDIVLMTLTDHTAVTAIEALIKLANRYGITLFTSEINSVDKGAALGCGIDQGAYGIHAAHMVQRILMDYGVPAHMPVQYARDFHVKLNRTTAEQQGLMVDPTLLFVMQSSSVIPA